MARNNFPPDSTVSNLLLRSLPMILDSLQHSMHTENKQSVRRSRTNNIPINANVRKQILVDRIANEMENNGSTPNLEAFLAQVIACNASQISRFEDVFNEIHGNTQSFATPSVVFGSILPTSLFTQRPPALPTVREEEKKICISFRDLKRASAESNCAICLEKFVERDEVEIRHCAHTFHKGCLTTWEKTGRTNGKLCPCCRA
jgi:hypothetical protein